MLAFGCILLLASKQGCTDKNNPETAIYQISLLLTTSLEKKEKKKQHAFEKMQTKSLSRKVCSLCCYICNASRKLFQESRPKSCLMQWVNPELKMSHFTKFDINCPINVAQIALKKAYISGWTSQCACVVRSAHLCFSGFLLWLYQLCIWSLWSRFN